MNKLQNIHKKQFDMKKLYLLTTLLITALIMSCNSDVFIEESGTIDKENAASRTINMTTNMPGESNTRVLLEKGESGINLTWQENDKIYLIFVENNEPIGKDEVTLSANDISSDGKKASFNFIIPEEVTGETFDIYGVHGGEGFVDELSYELKLPTIAQATGTSLQDLSDNNAVMIKFVAEDVSTDNPNISVNFEHIGSIFRLELTNELPDTDIPDTHFDVDLTGLTAESEATTIGAYVNVEGNGVYNPISGEYNNVSTSETRLPLGRNVPTNGPIPFEGTFDFWAWHIPISGEVWPALSLRILNIDLADPAYTSENSKPARTASTAIGKAFHFYATFDQHLYFTNAKSILTDTRDGNTYKTMKFGTNEWMVQNLRYMPGEGFGTDYRVLVGNNAAEATPTEEYRDYGVYYNWDTAMNACPPGWRLPESLEFFSLFSAEEAKAFKSDGDYHWNTDNGENSNGFNAYGGGYFYDNGGSYDITEFKELAAWWSSSEDGTVHQIKDKDAVDEAPWFNANDFNKDLSFVNVRCIRDTSSGGGVDH